MRLIGSSQWKREDWDKLTIDQWQKILASNDQNAIEKVTASICSLFPAIGDKISSHAAIGVVYNDQQLRKGNHIGHKEKFDRYFQLCLSDDSISHSDIVKVLQLFDENELIHFFKEIDKAGKCYDLLEEIHANHSDILPERAKIIIKALFCVSAAFDKTPQGFFMLSSSRYAENVLLRLFEVVPKEETVVLLKDIIKTADSTTLETVAAFLNLEELAYGRLAADGEEKNYPKVLLERELSEFEMIFCEKVKAYFAEKPLLEFDDCRMILYLLENFDKEYLDNYLNGLFVDPKNIIRFLEYSTSKWIGGEISYEIRDEYKKYLNDGQIISAIQQCRKDNTLFSMPDKAQLLSAVFWLYFDNAFDYDRNISEISAKQLLDTWKQ